MMITGEHLGGWMVADPAAGVLPPLLNPTTSMQQAIADGTLGVGFAAAGFLVFYMVGVNLALNRAGVISPGAVRSAGSSIGALLCGVNYPGMGTHDDFLTNGFAFTEHCRRLENRNCFGTLDEQYRRLVDKVLKPNVSEAITGRVCIVVSRGSTSHPIGEAVCKFSHRGEVMDALRASAFVPGWSAVEPKTELQGKPAFDGIFAQFLPCPEGVTFCIKVSALPPFSLRRVLTGLASPGELWGTLKATAFAVRTWLGPSPWEALRDVHARGVWSVLDWRAWAKILSAEPVADIFPGRWRRSALSPLQWHLFMLNPPDATTIRLMFEEGQADGEAWAKAQGWPTSSLE